jgi:hypothetical protein
MTWVRVEIDRMGNKVAHPEVKLLSTKLSERGKKMQTKFCQRKDVLVLMWVLFIVGFVACASAVVHLCFALKIAEKGGLSIVILGSGFDVNSQYPGAYLAFQNFLLTCISHLGFGLILLLEFWTVVTMRRHGDRLLEFMGKLYCYKINLMIWVLGALLIGKILLCGL